MTSIPRNNIEKRYPRWILVTISTVILVVLLSAFAFFATPEIFKPGEVTITGTVSAPDISLNRIVFTNTGCGTKSEAEIASGKYAISLDNQYSYNVSIVWTNGEGAMLEAQIATLILDTSNKSLVRDWVFQP